MAAEAKADLRRSAVQVGVTALEENAAGDGDSAVAALENLAAEYGTDEGDMWFWETAEGKAVQRRR